ncbi:MAG: beta strand repeat-containing protein, partial [Isosphaeraceae bacterium]
MPFRRHPEREVKARKREQIRRRRRYQIEGVPGLESRTLLSIVPRLTANGATFTGDGAADTLLLRVNATRQLEYSANGGAYTSNIGGGVLVVGANARIVADLGGGDDVLGVDATLANALSSVSGATLDYKGGAGSDVLRGPDVDSTWNLTGAGAGRVGLVSFDKVEGLVGGLVRDVFAFDDKPGFNGTVQGGGGADALDYSATNRSVSVDLAAGTATGLLGFTAIQDVTGGSGTDTLAGPNADNAWRIDGPGSGTVGSSRFAGFENLVGAGSRPDVFAIAPGGSLSGGIDGGAGPGDALDLSALASPLAVTLSRSSAGGFDGTGPLGFAGIDEIVGGAGVGDSLTDATGASSASWELSGTPAYRSGTRVLRFSGFEALAGGGGADTFLVSGARLERLSGGAGADRFVLADGASLAGPIDGGTGVDTLDLSASVTPRNVVLNALGATDGFAGTEASIAGGFTHVDAILGGQSLNDRLTGMNASASWDLAVIALYSSGGRSLSASGFDSFTGGSSDDVFRIANGTTVQGAIDGGAGSDTIDWSATISPRAATLLGPGSLDGFRGVEPSILAGFDDVETLVGGQSLNDRLLGQNASALWNLAATSTYQSGGTLQFSRFEGLVGGSADDVFRITTPPGGIIDGGAGTGVDTLDFGPSAGPIQVSLESSAPEGFRGSGTVGFVGIDAVLGSLSTRDTLIDRTNAPSSRWNLTAEPTFTIGTQTLRFGRIEDLTGGRGVELATGPVGSNASTSQVLSYDAATTTVRLVNASTSAVVASQVINPAADNLVRVVGTAGGNTLLIHASFHAAGLAAVFDARGGSDVLDLSSFPGGSTTALEKSDQQGYSGIGPVAFLGVDRLTGSSAAGDVLRDQTGTTAATWALSAAPSYSSGGRTLALSGYEALVGGAGIDTFQVPDGSSFGGAIDGGAGIDTVDWSDYRSTRQATLSALGGVDGFAGTEASIAGGFTNVDALIGGRAGDDRLTGRNADASWNLANGQYLSGASLGFNAFEALVGGAAADAFAISGNQAVSLVGGAGPDVFTFANGARIGGLLDGGPGVDVLDWSDYASTRVATLSGLGATDGFAGTEASIAGGFTNVDALIGGRAGDDRLTGRNADASWNLAAGQYVSGTTLGFTGFESLVGGSAADAFQIAGTQAVTLAGSAGADVFRFEAGAVVAGSIDGGAGIDTVDWSAASTPRRVALVNSGNLDGFSGTEISIVGGFTNVDAIRGSSGVDQLTGRDVSAVWRVAAVGSYSNGNATLGFESFEDLVGGKKEDDFTIVGAVVANLSGLKGKDVFRFAAGGTLSGRIDGGDDSDTIDWSASSTPRLVVLSALGGIDGFAGTEASVSAGFDNVEALVGGTGIDRLTGLDSQASWDVSAGRYTSGRSVDFSGFEALTGGSGTDAFAVRNSSAVSLLGGAGDDSFVIDDRAILGGAIDGGAGIDTVDWSDYRSTRQATLSALGGVDGFAGTEASIAGGFTNVDALIGGRAGDDRLTGRNADASWNLANGQYL